MTKDISEVLANPEPHVEYDREYWNFYFEVQRYREQQEDQHET